MRHTFLIITFFISSCIYSQIEQRKTEIAPKELKVIYGAEEELIPAIGDTIICSNQKTKKYQDGNFLTVEELFDNGKKYKVLVYPLSNLKYKTLTKYNESGNIILIANYSNGLVTGYFKKFYENGKIMEEGEYQNMTKIGEWKYYDQNGMLEKTEKY
jgi:hypothetical protein